MLYTAGNNDNITLLTNNIVFIIIFYATRYNIIIRLFYILRSRNEIGTLQHAPVAPASRKSYTSVCPRGAIDDVCFERSVVRDYTRNNNYYANYIILLL